MNTVYVIVLLCAVGANACVLPAPESTINWKKVPKNMKWAMNSDDKLTDILKCSRFSISSKFGGSSVTLSMRYGELTHQVFNYTAHHLSGNEYHFSHIFSSSWKNIIRHMYNKQSPAIIAGEKQYHDKNRLSFYHDKKYNYFIAVICLPNGKTAVWAFTRHNSVTPVLQSVIQRKLETKGITTPVVKSACPKNYRIKFDEMF